MSEKAVQSSVSLEILRSWWEIPAVAHYCQLFRDVFVIPAFEIEVLEEALLAENWEFFEVLLLHLLKGCYQRQDISSENFHSYLTDIVWYRWELEDGLVNPLQEKSFRDLSAKSIVQILLRLCVYRMDAPDVTDQLKAFAADSLRVDPVGEDRNGTLYWYFCETRLYKEEPPLNRVKQKRRTSLAETVKKKKEFMKSRKCKVKTLRQKDRAQYSKKSKKKKTGRLKKNEDCHRLEGGENERFPEISNKRMLTLCAQSEYMGTWSLVCERLEDWKDLAATFRGSAYRREQELYKTLVQTLIPQIGHLSTQKKKKELLTQPRRMSECIQKKQETHEKNVLLLKTKDGGRGSRECITKEESAGPLKQRENPTGKGKPQCTNLVPELYVFDTVRILHLSLTGKLKKYQKQTSGVCKEPSSEKRKKEEHLDLHSDYSDNEEYMSMFKVLETVKNHADSWPFTDPVKEDVPGYHKNIKAPMDLLTIEDNLIHKRYKTTDDFVAHFGLIFKEDELYPGKSEYTLMASSVKQCFHNAMRKYFPEEQSDSDEEEFTMDTTIKGKPEKRKRRSTPKKAAERNVLKLLDEEVNPRRYHKKTYKKDVAELCVQRQTQAAAPTAYQFIHTTKQPSLIAPSPCYVNRPQNVTMLPHSPMMPLLQTPSQESLSQAPFPTSKVFYPNNLFPVQWQSSISGSVLPYAWPVTYFIPAFPQPAPYLGTLERANQEGKKQHKTTPVVFEFIPQLPNILQKMEMPYSCDVVPCKTSPTHEPTLEGNATMGVGKHNVTE
ncbi:chromatin remodeling regulator CECR2-like isoform X2 [Lepisosteus oculatus]|uniref:chromatin remodeling regulator CECR2-like isoform X2 n=1 Tax=Lepisosteus oculatus TaxID=7918 RepID=UPI0035F5006A